MLTDRTICIATKLVSFTSKNFDPFLFISNHTKTNLCKYLLLNALCISGTKKKRNRHEYEYMNYSGCRVSVPCHKKK